MAAESLLLQIRSMEIQLAALKTQVKQWAPSPSQNASVPEQRFADLYGILAGQVSSSEADIEAALYHFDWEDEAVEGTQN